MPVRRPVISRRAIRIMQADGHPLYLFALRAQEILQIADVSRVSRTDTGEVIGYQRPVVKRHVQNIADYLNTGPALFPNSLILSLASTATFQLVRGPRNDDGIGDAGTLTIPLPTNGHAKPAWIVDGQQRAMALSRCKRRDFPVPVAAFVADDVSTQRDQFLRVNTTKPLPRGLISELLPKVDTLLPANLAARRVPAALCDILDRDPTSPFHGMIRRSSKPAGNTAVVSDTALIGVLQESFGNPAGCLFPYRNIATGDTDFEAVQRLLFLYWGAVRDAFPEAWGLPPARSRLMHSAGLKAVGRLMDRVMSSVNLRDARSTRRVRTEVTALASGCRWTAGEWEALGGMRWNELQDVPAHVRMLSNYLVRLYLQHRSTP